MELEVYKKDGTLSGEKITLAPGVFEIAPNDHAIYQAVRVYLANQRQGTHKTKTVSEVSGGGKKPYKQKKTGRARSGSSRSPLWKGGGTIFGPVPRDYSMSLPDKVNKLARKSAISYRVKESDVKIVEDFSFESPKTKDIVSILKALKLDDTKTLLLLSKTDSIVYKSGRNLPNLQILEANKVSAYDIMKNKVILFQKSAVEVIEKIF
ncbi:MAG: 50S ribosomal protein L4 [Bacteroidota bacterium]|nr:50S ribosomal protein L4 [Bacteroidota bacterium]